MHGRIERKRFTSTCLQGNPLDDPHERDVYVYVPEATPSGRRFPVILLLPGYGSNHLSILSYSPWEKNTVERFDQQVAAGESPPAILVLPDCMTRWGGSQFIDSVGTGRYQTYLADEVIPQVDQHFPTIPTREARAAAGRSSGGFGALRLALDRPELISAVASHAGDAAFEVSMRPMFTSAAIGFERAGGLAAFAERLPQGGPRNAPEFDAAFVLAASAAYSPEPAEPLGFVLPIDWQTAVLDEKVFARWLRFDPVELCGEEPYRSALRGQRLIFLDAGTRDEYYLDIAARQLAARLTSLGAPVVHEEFDDGHMNTAYRFDRSLPLLARALT